MLQVVDSEICFSRSSRESPEPGSKGETKLVKCKNLNLYAKDKKRAVCTRVFYFDYLPILLHREHIRKHIREHIRNALSLSLIRNSHRLSSHNFSKRLNNTSTLTN